jgi:hypothetical protein
VTDDLNKNEKMKKIILLLLVIHFGKSIFAQDSPKKIAIYRWNHGDDWVEAKESEEAKMVKFGYINKTYVCSLFADPQVGTVPINRWLNSKTGDWATVPESASDDMQRFGYTSKILLGYGYDMRKPNTLTIYRWELPSTGDWVTVPADQSDKMLEFGYTHKTFVAFTPR